MDEVPYLTSNSPSFEAELQSVWDQKLQFQSILLIVVGSDLSFMESIASYDHPLYQRIDAQKKIEPLNLAETAELLDQSATEAIDSYLITGGFPKIVASRLGHKSTSSFLQEATRDEAHPLVFTGQQMMTSEVPRKLKSWRVLESIGSGETTFGSIQTSAAVREKTVAEALAKLLEKKLIVFDDPLSNKPVKKRHLYRLADPYLRFWFQCQVAKSQAISVLVSA